MNKAASQARILIVDDEPANIRILYQILKADHETFFATSGENALAACRRYRPDLVLLDVVMPNMDGFEVCTLLKADPDTCDIPVIFATARSSEADETRGLEVGAIDFIAKPVSAPIVKARVRNHIELKRQSDLLRASSYVDGLTGVANRRRLDEALQKEWRRCERSGAYLGLIILDVDFFKAYNDTFGHLVGDECLRKVAEVLNNRVKRPADLVARYGGEEFVILLPETNPDAVKTVAEVLRSAVNDLGITHPGSSAAPHITISSGGTATIPRNDRDVTDLLRYADALLYQAKQRGRNQAVVEALSDPIPA